MKRQQRIVDGGSAVAGRNRIGRADRRSVGRARAGPAGTTGRSGPGYRPGGLSDRLRPVELAVRGSLGPGPNRRGETGMTSLATACLDLLIRIMWCRVARFFLVGRCPLFVFQGSIVTARPEQFAKLREAAERVARSHGLEIFDVQLRREPIGMVLRVVIDRPATGASGSTRGQRRHRRLPAGQPGLERAARRRGRVRAAGARRKPTRWKCRRPGSTVRCGTRRITGASTGRLAKVVTTEPIERQSAFAGRIAGVEDGSVLLEEGRKTHRVPLAKIKRAHLDVEF